MTDDSMNRINFCEKPANFCERLGDFCGRLGFSGEKPGNSGEKPGFFCKIIVVSVFFLIFADALWPHGCFCTLTSWVR